MKAILIDPFQKEVSEIEVENSYPHINKLIGCDCIDIGFSIDYEDGGRDVLYVDDEGLLKPNEFFAFVFNGVFKFAGKAVILGVDWQGEDRDVGVPIETVEQFYVKWIE